MFNKDKDANYRNEGEIFEGVVSKDKAKLAATNWGEGSAALTELLEYCILNGVKTYTSCKGHNKHDKAFIGFRDMPPIFYKYVISRYLTVTTCSYDLTRLGNHSPKLLTSFVREEEENRERKFKLLLEIIKEYVEKKGKIDKSEINDNVEKSVEYIFSKDGYGKRAYLGHDGSISYTNNMPDYFINSQTNKVEYAYSPLFRLRNWGRNVINRLTTDTVKKR